MESFLRCCGRAQPPHLGHPRTAADRDQHLIETHLPFVVESPLGTAYHRQRERHEDQNAYVSVTMPGGLADGPLNRSIAPGRGPIPFHPMIEASSTTWSSAALSDPAAGLETQFI